MIPKFIRYWLPPLLLMIAIFAMSSRQSIAVSDQYLYNFIFFKSIHVAEYAVLTLLLFRALFKTTALSIKHMLVFAALIALMYGISDEFHQTFVPTRTGKIRDIFIDSIGIFAMYYFLKTQIKLVKKYMY